MKKLNLLIAIIPITLCGVAWAECPSDYTVVDGRCIKTDTACDGNCTWVYDYDKQSLTYEGTGVIKYSTNTYGIGPIKDLTVGEGITGITQNTPATSTFMNIGSADGKLVLPSTLKDVGGYAMYGLGFGTVEINSENVQFASQSFRFAQGTEANIIIKPGSNVKAYENAFYSPGQNAEWGTGATLHFMCRSSNAADCGTGLENAKNSLINAGGSASIDLYKGYDKNGNWEEWSEDGHTVYTDSSKQKIMGKYDVSGNLLQSWNYNPDGSVLTYDKNGNLVGKTGKNFTSSELSALLKNKGNTVSITW